MRATRAAGVRLAGIPAEIDGDLGELAAGLVAGRGVSDERLFFGGAAPDMTPRCR
jgi:hypothetical protein